MTWSTWDISNFLFGLLGALAVLGPPMLWLTRRIRALSVFSDPRFEHFLDDWFGEQARPGFVARPGVPERLGKVEEGLEAVVRDTRQLQRNGGSHLADAIDKLVRESESRSGNAETLARIEGLLAAIRPATTVTNVVSPPGGSG